MTSSRCDVILWRHLQKFEFLVFLLNLARHFDFLLHFYAKPVTYVKLLYFGFQKTQTELKNIFSLDFYCKLKKCSFPENTRILKNFDDVSKKEQPLWKIFFCHFVGIRPSNNCTKFHVHSLIRSRDLKGGGSNRPPSGQFNLEKARFR